MGGKLKFTKMGPLLKFKLLQNLHQNRETPFFRAFQPHSERRNGRSRAAAIVRRIGTSEERDKERSVHLPYIDAATVFRLIDRIIDVVGAVFTRL